MSISRAADSVGRSQSTVSQQIAKLESADRQGPAQPPQGPRTGTHVRGRQARAICAPDPATQRRGLCVDVGRCADRFRPARRAARLLRPQFHDLAGALQGHASDGRPRGRGQSVREPDEAQRARRIRSGLLQAGEPAPRHGTVTLREQLVWVSGPNYSMEAQDSCR